MQGIALQGNENNDNFRQLMMLLGTKDESIIAHLKGAIGNKFVCFYLICLFLPVWLHFHVLKTFIVVVI